DIQLKQAKTQTELAKSGKLGSEKDKLDLDYLEQATGLTQDRELEKLDRRGSNNPQMKMEELAQKERIHNMDLEQKERASMRDAALKERSDIRNAQLKDAASQRDAIIKERVAQRQAQSKKGVN
ncbi:MAG: hypothetical protein HUJ56_12695, partial [Erysipelotrichaceae bacterium]|nr:hypothetical protein [Erysipelotrichaceae bacterium]